jgi:PiT family inorganic phosphate transporter
MKIVTRAVIKLAESRAGGWAGGNSISGYYRISVIFFVIGLSVLFDFLNGVRDGSNFISTVVSARAMPLRRSIVLAALSEFLGPFLFGVAVAGTFGTGILRPGSITLSVILAALASAIVWNGFTWLLSMPGSASHALIGGLIGAAWIEAGPGSILRGGITNVLLSLFLSPLLGLLLGYLALKFNRWLFQAAPLRINRSFNRVQAVTEAILALSYGANDSQKTMGLISLSLVISGRLGSFQVPSWVVALSAGSIAAGIIFGGQRMIRTLGGGFYRIRPIHGFTAQLAAAAVILGAARLGGPVSSTQVVTSSILGAGAAERVNKVRWSLAWTILQAWLITIPACGLMAGGLYALLNWLAR